MGLLAACCQPFRRPPTEHLIEQFRMNEPVPTNSLSSVLELEARQDDVLRQLDALNRQIEQVLAEDRLRSAPPNAAIPTAGKLGEKSQAATI